MIIDSKELTKGIEGSIIQSNELEDTSKALLSAYTKISELEQEILGQKQYFLEFKEQVITLQSIIGIHLQNNPKYLEQMKKIIVVEDSNEANLKNDDQRESKKKKKFKDDDQLILMTMKSYNEFLQQNNQDQPNQQFFLAESTDSDEQKPKLKQSKKNKSKHNADTKPYGDNNRIQAQSQGKLNEKTHSKNKKQENDFQIKDCRQQKNNISNPTKSNKRQGESLFEKNIVRIGKNAQDNQNTKKNNNFERDTKKPFTKNNGRYDRIMNQEKKNSVQDFQFKDCRELKQDESKKEKFRAENMFSQNKEIYSEARDDQEDIFVDDSEDLEQKDITKTVVSSKEARQNDSRSKRDMKVDPRDQLQNQINIELIGNETTFAEARQGTLITRGGKRGNEPPRQYTKIEDLLSESKQNGSGIKEAIQVNSSRLQQQDDIKNDLIETETSFAEARLNQKVTRGSKGINLSSRQDDQRSELIRSETSFDQARLSSKVTRGGKGNK